MLIGHQKQWQYLKKLAELDKLAHAYLFCGQEKLGKKTIAVEFAKWLFKDYNPPTASEVPAEGRRVEGGSESHSSLARAQRRVEKNECSSSRSEWAPDITKRQHPDFIFIEPEKKEIQISQIRECIWRLSLKSSTAPFKIAIIDEAHCLNQEAQNSLLKTLEEPRGQTILFLVTEYPERLFTTIISRCQILKFYSVPKEEIERYLRKQNILESEIKQMVEISAGRPGLAMDFISDPQKLKTQKTVISDLIKMSNSDLAFRFQYAKNLTKELQNLKDILDIWLRHFRSVLISSVNRASQTRAAAKAKRTSFFSSPSLRSVGEEEDLSSSPTGYSLSKLRDIIKLIQETNFLISTTNVNPRLALEILMMEI